MKVGLFVGLIPTLPAQEYYPVIEDRVVEEVVQPPIVEEELKQEGGWDLDLILAAAYDDNIFLSSSQPESSMTFRVAPTIAYTKGEALEGEGAFVKAAYRPTGVIYSDFSSDNRIDQQALATGGWRGKVTRWVYAGAYQKLGDATAETGAPTDRNQFENEVRFVWIPRDKISVEAALGYSKINYKDPVYFDSSDSYAEVALRYAYSPKTELGVAYQIGRFKVEGRPPQDTQRVTGIFNWAPREKIGLTLVAGAEHRSYSNSSRVRPVLEGRIDWAPRKGTEVYLNGYIREEASAFYAGQNISVKGLTAGVSQRLGGKWSAKLEGGYETNTYDQVYGTGTGGREDRIWFVRPAVVWQVGAESDLSFFYRVSDNASTDAAFGYDQQILGVELNHKF